MTERSSDNTLAAVSIGLQAVYVAGLLLVVQYAIRMFTVDWTWFDADPRQIALDQRQLILTVGPTTAVGLLGASLAWFLSRRADFREKWFLIANRYIAPLWFLSLPVAALAAWSWFEMVR